MKILNYGSLNIDYVYSVPNIVSPGETISSTSLELYPGGKGLNQSIALAKAGALVFHAGLIGNDGNLLLQTCKENGVDTNYIKKCDSRTGNAIIQVSEIGQNSIIVFPGANYQHTTDYIEDVLSNFEENDIIILQNEINLIHKVIDMAYEKNMKIFLNPSPFNNQMLMCDLQKIDYFMLNEIEAYQITNEKEIDKILKVMLEMFPKAKVVLTLGEHGSIYQDSSKRCKQEIYKTKAVDTTAAGDTFTGFFIASLMSNKTVEEALNIASKASAITVSRKGAAVSIPTMVEVEEFKVV